MGVIALHEILSYLIIGLGVMGGFVVLLVLALMIDDLWGDE